jgi:N-acetylglucosamine kinase-like BadF-type ATPase
MLGDVGSGFWIGQQALHAAARAADGVQDSETTVLPRVLALIGKEKPEVSESMLSIRLALEINFHRKRRT